MVGGVVELEIRVQDVEFVFRFFFNCMCFFVNSGCQGQLACTSTNLGDLENCQENP